MAGCIDVTLIILEGLLRVVNAALYVVLAPSELYYWATERPRGERDKVVIVGASFAGLEAQRNLSRDFDVTVVDFKDYFEYTPGVLRAFVEPGHMSSLTGRIPRSKNRFVEGAAVAVKPGSRELLVQSSESKAVTSIPYKYLLIATGSTYAGTIKASPDEASYTERLATWEAEAQRLAKAESVLIIGAGPVGVELAGEILTRYPEKKVTLTDMASDVCPAFRPKSRAHAKRWLEQRGCGLELGVPIDGKFPDLKVDARGCTLRGGKRLDADVVYRCMGFRPNTEWLRGGPLSAALDRRGFIRVNDYLQVEGFGDIFAMGDCMSHRSGEVKLGHTAELNAHLVVENLRRLRERGASRDRKDKLGDDEVTSLLRYPQGVVGASRTPFIYCLSLGKYDATMGFNWLVINGPLAALVKWTLEWTKVMACREEPIGTLFWKFADVVSLWLGRTLVKTETRQTAS